MTNGLSPEFAGFHAACLKEHTGLLQIGQRENLYQISRNTSDRNAVGFDSYSVNLAKVTPNDSEYDNIYWREFVEKWYPWKTIKLK